MNFVLYVEGIENGFYTYSDKEKKYKIGDHVWIKFRNSKKIGV
ncbi:MAG: primosomal protein, partial [Fusobacteria bacterium]